MLLLYLDFTLVNPLGQLANPEESEKKTMQGLNMSEPDSALQNDQQQRR